MLGLAVIVCHLAIKHQARSTKNQERTMSHVLDSLFHLSDNGTTVRTEILAGATAFLGSPTASSFSQQCLALAGWTLVR